ncbi:restriction endonuclease subunit S [Ectopseudomonas hydrolytica]|uniref:restriction endonuclease subunit S n=1 Tax=Ectopseudomonas hydrolytica TaxID=2493633 RepID=UPI003EE34B9A
MSDFPAGWLPVRLGEVTEFKYGKALPAAARDGGEFPVFGSNGVVGQHSMWISPAPTIVIGRKGSVGEICFSEENCSPIDTTYYVDTFEFFEPKFCFYLLKTLKLGDLNKSTAIPGLNRQDAYDLKIGLPPLVEQTRIAAKLDELLAQVDTLKSRIDAIPALLKRFRQSVLAAAVSGRLTEEWRGNAESCPLAQPPLVFFERDQGSVPSDWRWSMLVKLAVLESGHTPRKSISAYWENGDVPWISLQDIRAADGKEIFKTKHMPTMLGIENSSARLLPAGTVCFSRDISVGFVTIMGRSMATTQHFANWVCKDELLPKYLMYAFMAGREHLLRSGQGSTVKTIYMPALKELRLLLPPLAEQSEIVRRVEQLFAFADQLEAKVASAKSRIDHLTQSILAKAFRGELVPQDPNDEPASVLLERIKTQRAAAPKAKRGRKASA